MLTSVIAVVSNVMVTVTSPPKPGQVAEYVPGVYDATVASAARARLATEERPARAAVAATPAMTWRRVCMDSILFPYL